MTCLLMQEVKSHPVWVRGLKQDKLDAERQKSATSHPVWVRGLKQDCRGRNGIHAVSHPVWVRGLKH